jgi:NAD(P)-dependent dehydrogenase (short-subunit alcohol dehydrogenase family)
MTMQQNRSRQRVALITGANTGIGRVTALELAKQGLHVFVACRSKQRTQALLEQARSAAPDAKIEWLALDLASFESIHQCAEAFLSRGLPLHLLINNAGLAGAKGVTKEGFELAFGVNHLGHFLLTSLLLERIQSSAPARIVTVASRAHYRAPGIDWEALRAPTRSRLAIAEYGVSKLANILFSAELGRRLQGSGVTTYSLHPGVVASEVWRSAPKLLGALIKPFMLAPEEGAATSLYCATNAGVSEQTGLYYDKCQIKEPSKMARDLSMAAELWQRSEEWVRDYLQPQ